jgi:hypothetical protein
MAQSNSAHGKNFQKDLVGECHLLASKGKIRGIITKFGVRHPGYSSPDQYYAPIVITLSNDEQWAVFTTTTCRTDRIKGQQWDAEHIKMFAPQIKRAYLVYPNEISKSDKDAFISQKAKYDNHWEYSCIDDILSVDDFIREVENV